MVEINNNLKIKFLQQNDGTSIADEEIRLRAIAESYALCENSIAVLSNLRTDKSYIHFGGNSKFFDFEPVGYNMVIDSVWEEMIFEKIHPDDLRKSNLQELSFFRMVSSSHSKEAFAWHMETIVRMKDKTGSYLPVKHRIHYFGSSGKAGICYALCLYNITKENDNFAYIINSQTGEKRILEASPSSILTEQEKRILKMVQEGKASKAIAEKLDISKCTVDRHRQNIISKLQVGNTTEAVFKAKQLGII